jgi:hypothetical protein
MDAAKIGGVEELTPEIAEPAETKNKKEILHSVLGISSICSLRSPRPPR